MTTPQRVLIISLGVYPTNQAMAVLIHALAKELGLDNVVVVGEKCDTDDPWDKVNYPLYYINPKTLGLRRGKDYQKWLSYPATVRRIKSISDKHQCTSILCPFPDEFYMAISLAVAKKTKLPFYPWFHNTYLENRSGIWEVFARYLQPRVFRQAKKVLTISEGLTNYYSSAYPETKFETLLHGFNLPEAKLLNFDIDTNEKIRFAYTGSFNESCREASVRLCKVIVSNPNYELQVFGKGSALQLLNHGIPEEKMVVHGFYSDEKFLEKLQACHIMLLPHGFDGKWKQIEFDTIFPTRTIPLLFSNRPILLHSPEKVFLTKFFSKHKCGFIVSSKDESEIKETISAIIGDKDTRDSVIQNAQRIVHMYDVKNVKQHLWDILEASN